MDRARDVCQIVLVERHRGTGAVVNGFVSGFGYTENCAVASTVAHGDGDWEIAQFCNATLVAANTYDLTKLLRGRLGSEHAMRSALPAGATVVLLEGALHR
jgi:adenine deaminase